MAKIVVVTSGKGGVGKTTTSASFATGLALRGHKTAVIDFDVGLRNLDLIMGVERRVVYDLINVINDEIKRLKLLDLEFANEALTDTALHAGRLMAAMIPMAVLVMQWSTIVLVWFAAGRLGAGAMQVGSLVAFLAYV
eukprot:gene10907-13850_t